MTVELRTFADFDGARSASIETESFRETRAGADATTAADPCCCSTRHRPAHTAQDHTAQDCVYSYGQEKNMRRRTKGVIVYLTQSRHSSCAEIGFECVLPAINLLFCFTCFFPFVFASPCLPWRPLTRRPALRRWAQLVQHPQGERGVAIHQLPKGTA